MHLRSITVALAVVLTVAALGGCSGGASAPPAAPQSNAQAVKGEQLVQTKCKMCHSLDRVYSKKADRAGWESTVAKMQSKGMVLTDEEKTAILEYLSTMQPTK